jgi:hypothetical protein
VCCDRLVGSISCSFLAGGLEVARFPGESSADVMRRSVDEIGARSDIEGYCPARGSPR